MTAPAPRISFVLTFYLHVFFCKMSKSFACFLLVVLSGFFFFVYVFLFSFLVALWHMEFPGQVQQRWILDPLCWARHQTCIPALQRCHLLLCHSGNSLSILLIFRCSLDILGTSSLSDSYITNIFFQYVFHSNR